ncbi:MAG: hypothetical protein EXQ67_03225 [Thermoleophilia bacterium]|nr:hypothetical protein [Thermoleophilia bacterium]
MLSTDTLLLTRAQRDLYAELDGDTVEDLERFAGALVARVVILVRHRCVHGRDQGLTLAQAERLYERVVVGPRTDETRAAIWSLVEWLTRWPWGPGAYGAIDRLVVAGVIVDELARDSA